MNVNGSFLTILKDWFRIPWKVGTKRISFDAVAPIFLVPILLFLAATNVWISLIVAFVTILFLLYAYKIQVRNSSPTKFFLLWTVSSIFTIWLIFEFKVQSFLEITLNENIVFNILFNGSIFCIYKVRQNATIVTKKDSYNDEQNEILINVENDSIRDLEEFCTFCKCKKAERTVHCTICQQCVIDQDFHNVWFDCCINKHNRHYFLLFLILGILALLFESLLTFTTVCYSTRFFEIIHLPNDCTDVFDDMRYSICFVCGVYSLAVGLYLLWFFIQQCWFISLGITGSEWRQFSNQNRYGIFMSHRPYSKGFLKNWIAYILKH